MDKLSNLQAQSQQQKALTPETETMGTLADASSAKTNTPSPLFNNVETMGSVASNSTGGSSSSGSSSGGSTNYVC